MEVVSRTELKRYQEIRIDLCLLRRGLKSRYT